MSRVVISHEAPVARDATAACPYGCDGGWLPVPRDDSRVYSPEWDGQRAWLTWETTPYGVTAGTRHRLGGDGRCLDCREQAPPRTPDPFPEEVPCPSCDEEKFLDEGEPETGWSLAALDAMLREAGGQPDDVWPGHWVVGNSLVRVYELGPDVWQFTVSISEMV